MACVIGGGRHHRIIGGADHVGHFGAQHQRLIGQRQRRLLGKGVLGPEQDDLHRLAQRQDLRGHIAQAVVHAQEDKGRLDRAVFFEAEETVLIGPSGLQALDLPCEVRHQPIHPRHV